MKEIRIHKQRATTRMGHLPVEGGGLNACLLYTSDAADE